MEILSSMKTQASHQIKFFRYHTFYDVYQSLQNVSLIKRSWEFFFKGWVSKNTSFAFVTRKKREKRSAKGLEFQNSESTIDFSCYIDTEENKFTNKGISFLSLSFVHKYSYKQSEMNYNTKVQKARKIYQDLNYSGCHKIL